VRRPPGARIALLACALLAAATACDRSQDASAETASAAVPMPAPAPLTAVVTDSAVIGGTQLWVLTRGTECAVRYEGPSPGELALVPKPPCHFAHREGTPQRFAYQDVAVRAAFVVLGTPASDAMLAKWNVKAGTPCGVETQGVLLKADTVLVTRAVHRNLLACRDRGVDEKEFFAFAHDG
jgi:hypothetical protein